MQESHTDTTGLVCALARAAVQDSFAAELDLFDVVWKRFLARPATRRDQSEAGLRIHPDEDHAFRTPFVIMTVAAIIDALPQETWVIDYEKVSAAVREAAKSLGVIGPQLGEIVEAVSPKIHRAMALLAGKQSTQSQVQSAPSSRIQPPVVWVEWWIDGGLASKEPQAISYEEVALDPRSLRAQLTVDEWNPRFIGPAEAVPFREFRGQRGFTGLWLALDRTGRFFSMDEIGKHREFPELGTQDRALTRYVSDAQKILMRLLGAKIIPRATHRRYAVPADCWSWCWIRNDRDRIRSILLGSDRAARKNS
jgi:hypothetical protein